MKWTTLQSENFKYIRMGKETEYQYERDNDGIPFTAMTGMKIVVVGHEEGNQTSVSKTFNVHFALGVSKSERYTVADNYEFYSKEQRDELEKILDDELEKELAIVKKDYE